MPGGACCDNGYRSSDQWALSCPPSPFFSRGSGYCDSIGRFLQKNKEKDRRGVDEWAHLNNRNYRWWPLGQMMAISLSTWDTRLSRWSCGRLPGLAWRKSSWLLIMMCGRPSSVGRSLRCSLPYEFENVDADGFDAVIKEGQLPQGTDLLPASPKIGFLRRTFFPTRHKSLWPYKVATSSKDSVRYRTCRKIMSSRRRLVVTMAMVRRSFSFRRRFEEAWCASADCVLEEFVNFWSLEFRSS